MMRGRLILFDGGSGVLCLQVCPTTGRVGIDDGLWVEEGAK